MRLHLECCLLQWSENRPSLTRTNHHSMHSNLTHTMTNHHRSTPYHQQLHQSSHLRSNLRHRSNLHSNSMTSHPLTPRHLQPWRLLAFGDTLRSNVHGIHKHPVPFPLPFPLLVQCPFPFHVPSNLPLPFPPFFPFPLLNPLPFNAPMPWVRTCQDCWTCASNFPGVYSGSNSSQCQESHRTC